MELAASSFSFLLGALLVFAAVTDVVLSAQWSYEGVKGPLQWHKLFPQACSGKYQSPIDIHPEMTVYNPALKDFAIWYDPPRPGSTMTVSNNGHTIVVVTSGDFYVTNGGLPYIYKTAQFHFHWGHAKHHGSEHLIDGKAFPLELHIVNYNTDLYPGIAEAVTEKQGLAVLGVMFEVVKDDNPDLEPIIAAMEHVKDPEEGKQVQITPLSLRSLLPEDISEYYRYNGSLTTPGCFESVVWTVFANPRPISHRQVHQFRKMLQMRHVASGGNGHHKRSADYASMASPAERRRERRALEVLNELALTPAEQDRFQRDLEHKRHQAEEQAARMDEENARASHDHMVKEEHAEVVEVVEVTEQNGMSEVEVEFLQDELVNNFRPVQPLNERTVYRSFKLSHRHSHHQHGDHHHSASSNSFDSHGRDSLPAPSSGGRGSEEHMSEERTRSKQYPSVGGAAPGALAASLFLCVTSCLLTALVRLS